VSVAIDLRVIRATLAKDPEKAVGQLSAAQEQLALGLDDLRELARGIHPAVLTDRGLAAALEALAARAPLPVELAADLDERLPGPVEAAAYYVVAEAVANVQKHAGATAIVVRLERRGDELAVEVADDGRGGADEQGGGLRGLADRVEALGGTLLVDSPQGRGTRLTARIPLG